MKDVNFNINITILHYKATHVLVLNIPGGPFILSLGIKWQIVNLAKAPIHLIDIFVHYWRSTKSRLPRPAKPFKYFVGQKMIDRLNLINN